MTHLHSMEDHMKESQNHQEKDSSRSQDTDDNTRSERSVVPLLKLDLSLISHPLVSYYIQLELFWGSINEVAILNTGISWYRLVPLYICAPTQMSAYLVGHLRALQMKFLCQIARSISYCNRGGDEVQSCLSHVINMLPIKKLCTTNFTTCCGFSVKHHMEVCVTLFWDTSLVTHTWIHILRIKSQMPNCPYADSVPFDSDRFTKTHPNTRTQKEEHSIR